MRRGGDIASDHQLVVAKLKPKLKAQRRKEAQPNRYDIDLLRKEKMVRRGMILGWSVGIGFWPWKCEMKSGMLMRCGEM